MAAPVFDPTRSIVSAPGTAGGPCSQTCSCDRCQYLRTIAARICVLCNHRIGYDRPFTEDTSARCFIHLACAARPLPSFDPPAPPAAPLARALAAAHNATPSPLPHPTRQPSVAAAAALSYWSNPRSLSRLRRYGPHKPQADPILSLPASAALP